TDLPDAGRLPELQLRSEQRGNQLIPQEHGNEADWTGNRENRQAADGLVVAHSVKRTPSPLLLGRPAISRPWGRTWRQVERDRPTQGCLPWDATITSMDTSAEPRKLTLDDCLSTVVEGYLLPDLASMTDDIEWKDQGAV